ncbi:MAG: hypothetical protein SGJ13_05720 [Actinomycetota bacterium]|nr:hypothetical protein [Actinomycetota bacterium]
MAFAVTHEDPPRVLIAEDEQVLSRLLALELVAATRPSDLNAAQLTAIRDALLDERWADAVVAWIAATDIIVDVYSTEAVRSATHLDELRTSLELRVAPIFDDGDA